LGLDFPGYGPYARPRTPQARLANETWQPTLGSQHLASQRSIVTEETDFAPVYAGGRAVGKTTKQ
jgi:hypothetical protein